MTQAPYVLPEASLNSKSYQKTSNLVFSDISQSFVPSSGQTGDFQTVPSHFGFGYAVGVQSGKEQCMTKENFISGNNLCIADPLNCQSGLSFSVWVRVYYSDNVFDMSSAGPQDDQYFISTGGDVYGSPGVAVGVRKQDLFAVVSTGTQYWQVSIRGPVPNNTWTNVGISWNKNDQGLKVFVNNVIKGFQPTPQTSPTSLPPFNPPLLTIGCRKNSGDLNYSGFVSADIDESSFWENSLNGSETEFFLGGYDANLTTLEIPKELALLLPKVDLHDLDQRKVAQKLFSQQTKEKKYCFPSTYAASEITTSLFDKSYLTSMAVSSESTTDLYYLGNILLTLLNEKQLPISIAPDDALSMMEVAESFSNLLAPCNKPIWLKVQNQTENVGVIQLISKFKKWNAKLVQNMNITEVYPFCHEQLEENFYIKFCKMTVGDLRAMAQRVLLPDYNNPTLQTLRKMWNDMLVDRISFPTNLFYDYICDDRLVSFIFHYYGNVQEIVSTEAQPIYIDGKLKRAVNSRLLSLDIVVDFGKDEYQDHDPSLKNCEIISDLLQDQFVKFKMEHSYNVPAKYSRTLHQLFANTSEVEKRICVRWNDDLSDFGAWDSKGCAMVATNDQYSICACQEFGIFSILAIKSAPKIVPDEPYWLYFFRYVIYSLSAVAIALYIIVVLISSDLKDQLHLVGLNLAVAILVGSISMVLTDFEQVKDNRDACILFGSLIHLFYGAVGVWMVGLSHASFRGITAGIIGGHLGGYMFICWGLALASVGVPFLNWVADLGTDPRCFIGWENEAKLAFFFPQMLFCLVSFFFAATVLCNLATPALRKENLIDDYVSFCRGAALLVIVLSLTWTLGLFTYVRFSFYVTGPDFYPIFQVLNGTSGLCLFIFIGLGSKRFRTALKGQAAERREMLRKFAFGLPMSQDDQNRKIMK